VTGRKGGPATATGKRGRKRTAVGPRAVRLYCSGLTVTEAARRLGVSIQRVSYLLAEAGADGWANRRARERAA
jgi:hypothetical protein